MPRISGSRRWTSSRGMGTMLPKAFVRVARIRPPGPLADRLSRGGLPKNLIINEAPGILHRLDQSAFIVARRRPGLLVLNLGILQLRGVSGREPG